MAYKRKSRSTLLTTATRESILLAKPQYEDKIILSLTVEAAEILATVCDFIAGHPDGPRGEINAIKNALEDAEVSPVGLEVNRQYFGIYLKGYSDPRDDE